MRTRVKICGLTRLEDAELAADLGADALGFVLEPSSRRSIHADVEALKIPERVGPYALCVAVLGPYRPVPHQFHMIQCVDDLPRQERRPALKALRIASDESVESVLERIGNRQTVLLDAFDTQLYGGTGRRVDWAVAAEVVVRTRAKVILAGGLTPDNVAQAVQWVRPYAVDVSGGIEAEIGIKDVGKLRAFIQAARR